MASSGNEIERWTHRQGGRIGELEEPMSSLENGNCLSPMKSISSVEHLLHLPGRADSAYSSFSGGSNVPEYPTPSCYGENCCLPPEQVPYMDSEYVRGIYNVSAANSDPRGLHPYRAPDLSIPSNSESTGLAERCGSTPTPGTSGQGPPPAAAPPPSPPTRLDSYKVTRHLENSRGRRSEGGMQPAPGLQDSQLADGDAPRSQHGDEVTEQDRVAARGKTLENKGCSSDSTNEVSVSKIQGLKMEENGECSPSQQPVKRNNPHIFSRPSSFIFQEYLKTDSVGNVPKILSAYNSVHAYKIPEEMNSRSSPPVHTSPDTVNDTQEDKQYSCSVPKPTVRGVGPEARQQKGSVPCAQGPLPAESRSDADQDVFEESCDLKYMEGALLIKNASRRVNSCTDENQHDDSDGKIGSDVREALLDPQAKARRSPLSCSSGAVGAEPPHREEPEQGDEQCRENTSQMSFFRPKEDSASQFLREVRKEKQANKSSPELSMHLEQEEPPVRYQKYQPEFQKQLLRELQGDLAGEQITRQTTPMLYYLSGGKTTNILHHHKLTQCQEDSRNSPKEFPVSSYSASARCAEIQRENNPVGRAPHHRQCSADDLPLEAEDLILGSPASSMDESFKNDYREKLKVAQKKVLRETSFKRKDLQMSLPVRLRQKASKRPSIEHLRSFSLSSASENAMPVPCFPSHLESLESFSRDEEITRPQTGRIGGRKRVTKEQKKLCYSEPEKLDQLADKEVSWSQVRDEITEQDVVAARRRTLENRGRALSSSSISRTELKQIQQTALIEYMERKINQRPGSSQHLPLHKPPLQKRLSHPKWPPGKISNPNRKLQNNEVFCQVFSKEKSPDVFPPLAFVSPLSVSSRCDPNSAGTTASEHHPSASEAAGTCTGKCVSAESPLQAGDPASGRAPERSKSTTPSTQGAAGRAGGAAAPSRRCGTWRGTPSFRDPEKGGCENHEYKDSDITGGACCQDTKELTPEASIPVPRSRSKEDAEVQEECGTKSLNDNALTKCPEQQLAASPEEVTHCHTASAQPRHGAKNTAKGLVPKETSVHNSQEDILPERERDPPKRRLQSPEDQRYEALAMEIVAKDNSLVDILMPHPLRKTALDLMEGLFPVNISMLDKSHRKKGDAQRVQGNDRKNSRDGPEECPESEHDAKQRSEDPTSKGNRVLNRIRHSTNDLDDLTSKKLELISSLRAKLQSLWEERELVLSEARECAERGEELEATVRDVCKPNEFERYMMFIGDLEKVVSLLLCLSSRLARVQNAMRRIDGNTDAEEKQSLNERHKLLSRQREDAKDLKENLDRRERVVSGILAKYLSDQRLQDYRRFVQVKTSLLIEQKDLEEQIKFFEEQLENLEKSIPL
ncbi:protein Shroom1 isoform X1 [Athene noctua]|uniref:protein Shroom1 isoform X1 n=1 Tax=Athene noctua TaxID=126797 RepID=UPI003EBC1D71